MEGAEWDEGSQEEPRSGVCQQQNLCCGRNERTGYGTHTHTLFWVCLGYIFMCECIGGLDSVEYYDIGRNEWHVAAAMPWRGMNVRCAAVSGVIYVLAGFQGVGRLGHILEYHTDTDRYTHTHLCMISCVFYLTPSCVWFPVCVLSYSFVCVCRWVTCSKVRAFPVTSCLICVVDTCGAKEEETESTHTHTVPPSSSTA